MNSTKKSKKSSFSCFGLIYPHQATTKGWLESQCHCTEGTALISQHGTQYHAMQLGLTEPLQKLCEKYDDDTFFMLDDIKDILKEMLGGMISAGLLETFIAPMTHS